jgi:hypothetical protein
MARSQSLCIAVSLALCVLTASACGGSREKPGGEVKARPLPEIWKDVLAARDQFRVVSDKDLADVTHEDCALAGAAGRQLDQLSTELMQRIAETSSIDEGKKRTLASPLTQLQGVGNKLREAALDEAPGSFVVFKFPLDEALHAVESYFTAGELGAESVASRPNYESKPPPAPLSPV